jgi:cation diffusion facilitator family transporter
MHQKSFERKTMIVMLLTIVTMVVEVLFGLLTNSMALLADGIHMGSHVMAIGFSWFAYVMVRKADASKRYRLDSRRLLSLSGYTSGLFLLVFAVVIAFEAVKRLFHPVDIDYNEAIWVAVIGLVVNLVSAVILGHDHEEADHNIRAAYLHVLADAMTSVAAIAGLLAGKFFGYVWVDAAAAVLSSLVIIKWSIGLLFESGSNLLDFKKLRSEN